MVLLEVIRLPRTWVLVRGVLVVTKAEQQIIWPGRQQAETLVQLDITL